MAQRDDTRNYVDEPTIAVSGSGRHVAFASYAALVPADTNQRRDIYVLDRATGTVTLESVTSDGRASAVDSSYPGISDDGRVLVYQTTVQSTDSHRAAVVVRDRAAGTSTIVGAGPPSAWSGAPAISRDGAVVAFVSAATDIVPGPDANGPGDDVYVMNVATRAIDRVSVDRAGVQPTAGASFAPAISGDGRYIAFTSTAPLAGSIPTVREPILAPPRFSQIYVRDRAQMTTRLVSGTPAGMPADGPAWRGAIDAAGRYVAFVSTAANLTRDDRGRGADVFVADLATGTITLISRSARGGAGNGPSASPVLSADGRLVAFQSEASDLLCARGCTASAEDINLLWDVFLFDRRVGAMTRVSGGEAGGWLEATVGPAINATGEVIAFSSRHPIDAIDTKNDFDLFIRSLSAR